MIEITQAKSKLWSRLGSRAIFGQAILDCAKDRDGFYVITADLCQSSGLTRFASEYPDRFINAGIAEQNMIGIAAGLSMNGMNVFATSFSPFITMRACEQVRMNMGYMQHNIKTVGLGSGLVMGQLGNSHFGIEDVSVMRAIPGMTVIEPCDGAEIYKVVESLMDYKKPAYIRLTGGPNLPIVYNENFEYKIGKAITLNKGNDIAIIASGTMVYYALEAAKKLEKDGIVSEVIDMHTIKPLDTDIIDKQLNKKLIVTIEEATVIGGLGGAVAEYITAKSCRPIQLTLGINDKFVKTGSYEYMLDQCGLTADKIYASIKKQISVL